jgi:hypothetical protein
MSMAITNFWEQSHGSSPPPANTYVTEDGSQEYVTEDGSQPYVPES